MVRADAVVTEGAARAKVPENAHTEMTLGALPRHVDANVVEGARRKVGFVLLDAREEAEETSARNDTEARDFPVCDEYAGELVLRRHVNASA